MENKDRISNQQIKALLVTTAIGVGVLSLPSDVAMILENDGWIAILLGGLIPIPIILMTNRLLKMYPNKSFFEICKQVMNPIVAYLFFILFFIYTIVVQSYVSRLFAEVIKAYLLETTPIGVIILAMLFSVSYIARSRIEVLARVAVMVYPIILAFPILLLVVNLPDLDYTNIFPLFNINYGEIPNGVVTTYFSYIGYEIVLLAFNISDDKSNSLKYSLRGLYTVIGVYLIIFFVTLSQYGIYQLKREIWPTIAVIKEINLPGYFVENLDGIMMAVWVMVVYSTLGSFSHMAGIALKEIFRTKTHEVFIPLLIPIIYAISLIPDNLITTYKIMGSFLNYLALIGTIILPTITFIVAYIKKRRMKT
ncbi:GerAB/ArcD/ProY family transporter [Tepidimicrobium xylanilyticum]